MSAGRKKARRCASCGAPEVLSCGGLYSNLTNFLGGGICMDCINRAVNEADAEEQTAEATQ